MIVCDVFHAGLPTRAEWVDVMDFAPAGGTVEAGVEAAAVSRGDHRALAGVVHALRSAEVQPLAVIVEENRHHSAIARVTLHGGDGDAGVLAFDGANTGASDFHCLARDCPDRGRPHGSG